MAELLKVCFDEMMKSGNCSFESFMEKMNDAGINVDAWKQAYDGNRLPRRMTKSTLAIQNSNLEKEIVMLRTKEHRKGYDKNKRTLANFDVEKKDGNTVLIPKTRLAEIILLNSSHDLKLSAPPSDYIEHLEDENSKLKEEKFNLMESNHYLYNQYHALHILSYGLQETNNWQKEVIQRMQENEFEMSSEINDLKSVVRTLSRRLNYDVEFDEESDQGYSSDVIMESDQEEDINIDENSDNEYDSNDEENEIFEDLDDLLEQYEQRQRMEMARDALAELQILDDENSDNEDYNFLYFGEREHR
uniref:NSP3 n=1 Tax=Rotavirus G TaxID=183407 RepID=A0A345ANN2_9REOV|nr:NSP3 [Rotavirus G]